MGYVSAFFPEKHGSAGVQPICSSSNGMRPGKAFWESICLP